MPPTAAPVASRFSVHLGFTKASASPERVVVHALPGPEHANVAGMVHGGYLAALLDSATGWAVHAAAEQGVHAPHLQLSIHYLRPATIGEPLEAIGRCLVTGRRVISAEAEVLQGGRLIAKGTSTNLVAGMHR